ncbi:hypothetical protein LJC52_02840 [Bacteroidales bacterium OttesenSCG-928-A17]|nr:hypothetical protein [Bacteroidales bacterium OttesenSCG-928-A17]
MGTKSSLKRRKTRDELKKLFGEGQRATSEGFADLIDSMVNYIDDRVEGKLELVSEEESDAAIEFRKKRIDSDSLWTIALNRDNCLVITKKNDTIPCLMLHPDNKIEIGNGSDVIINGRIYADSYIGNAGGLLELPADGKWHEVIAGSKTSKSYEILACCKTDYSSLGFLLTQAIASQCNNQPTHLSVKSLSWKSFFSKHIQLKWFKNDLACSLKIRTKKSYGADTFIKVTIREII